MKGKAEERHNTFIISKVICVKGCFNSYKWWKSYMISTFCTEVTSTYSTTPSEPFCPGTIIGTKCFKWQLSIRNAL